MRRISVPTSVALAGLFLAILAIASASPGYLSFVEAKRVGIFGISGLAGPTSVTLSPDGQHLYATGFLGDAVVVFQRDATTGRLRFVEAQREGITGLNGASAVVVSPDGRHVYASSGSTFGFTEGDNAVVAFQRDPASGRLTWQAVYQDGVDGVDGLAGASSLAISPDGAHIYAAGPQENALAVFQRDPTTGLLTFVQRQESVSGVCWVTVSPDGRHVYAVGFLDDAVAVYARNPATGMLQAVEVQKDGVAGVDGLDAASYVLVSPDGRHVYATGTEDDAVVVFERDGGTGRLTYLEMQKDGRDGNDGLEGAHAVAITPDGAYVLVPAAFEHALAMFARDATGRLRFLEAHKDGVAGVDGLDGARSAVVSGDGRFVYVAGFFDYAIAVFGFEGPGITPSPTATAVPAPQVRPVGGYGEVLLGLPGAKVWLIVVTVGAGLLLQMWRKWGLWSRQ